MSRFEGLDRTAITPTDTRDLSDVLLRPYVERMCEIVRRELHIPAWARWIATDADGQVWAYAQRPQLIVSERCWAPFYPHSKLAFVNRVSPSLDWRTSLLELPESTEHGERFDALLVCCVVAVFIGLSVVGVVAGWW